MNVTVPSVESTRGMVMTCAGRSPTIWTWSVFNARRSAAWVCAVRTDWRSSAAVFTQHFYVSYPQVSAATRDNPPVVRPWQSLDGLAARSVPAISVP